MATSSLVLDKSRSPLGYYVHHHGSGHMRRASMIIKYISRPVILFSSLPEPPDLPNNVTYVQLPSDIVTGYVSPTGSAFHYTPYSGHIFTRNMSLIKGWQKYHIKDLYVDVSIEVAVLGKLFGLRVGHAVMHGLRTDPPHQYGYQAVDYLLAHMSKSFSQQLVRKSMTPVFYSGGISRYTKQTIRPVSHYENVVITSSPASKVGFETPIIRAAASNPLIHWHVVGAKIITKLPNLTSYGIVDDPFDIYMNADSIIGSGGNNTIMEIASLGKPFICIPEERPFREQVIAAKSLEKLNAAVYLSRWPLPNKWEHIFEVASDVSLTSFQNLVSDDAAQKAATVIQSSGQL